MERCSTKIFLCMGEIGFWASPHGFRVSFWRCINVSYRIELYLFWFVRSAQHCWPFSLKLWIQLSFPAWLICRRPSFCEAHWYVAAIWIAPLLIGALMEVWAAFPFGDCFWCIDSCLDCIIGGIVLWFVSAFFGWFDACVLPHRWIVVCKCSGFELVNFW